MTNTEIVDIIAHNRTVEEIATNIRVDKHYFQDFIQDIYLILLNYPNSKLQPLYTSGEMQYFITRIMLNQYRSSSSQFTRKYRKYNRRKTELDLNRLPVIECNSTPYAYNYPG